jgi:hypothetical protein
LDPTTCACECEVTHCCSCAIFDGNNYQYVCLSDQTSFAQCFTACTEQGGVVNVFGPVPTSGLAFVCNAAGDGCIKTCDARDAP